MSGPHHLWSGNWEDESARAGEQRAALPQPVEIEPEPEPEERTSFWRRGTTLYTLGAVVLVLLVGVAFAAVLSGGGSPNHQSKKPQYTVTTTPSPTTGPSGGAAVQSAPTPSSGPTANWLGMQIVSSPSGAVVSTVALGSAGDRHGFDPGDVFNSINGKQINSARQIRSATANLPLGSFIDVEINRGSTVITLQFALKDRPTIQP